MTLQELVQQNRIDELRSLLKSGEIVQVRDVLLTKEDYTLYQEEKRLEEYYDMLQGVRKVLLNSTYGATLNEFCRFGDPRLGASTTGSGRQITTHMIETIAKGLIGDGAPKIKKTIEFDPKSGENINTYTIDVPKDLGPIYSDTDSCYFVMDRLVDNIDDAVACADAIVAQVNDSFPQFLREAFNCQDGFDKRISANREVVCRSGLYRMKKKYVLLVLDREGKRIPIDDEKALYTKGSDIAISSTPELIRQMLKDVTLMVLKGEPKDKIDELVLNFRRSLKNIHHDDKLNIIEFATVTSIRKYDEYFMKWERIEKPGLGRVTMPSQVRAAINHNDFIDKIGDKSTQKLIAGQKVKLLWLKPNEHEYQNMAFSSDSDELPSWFKQHFEVDLSETEAKLIDQKLEKIYIPLGWDIPTEHSVQVGKLLSFDE